MAVSTAQDDRKKALNLAIAQIEKSCGKGSIMKMGAESARVRIDAIPTGAINLDAAIGVGGIPRGRITEIYGPESSGKTTLCLHVVANAQRAGGVAAFIDAEHALDIDYAKKLGVDVESLLVSQPDTGEQALEICEILVRSGAVDVVVIDSVAALVPKAEIEGEMGDSHMGLQARLMSQSLGVTRVKSMLRIDKRRRAALFLNLSNCMQCQCRFAGTFRTIDLNNSPLWVSAAQCQVKAQCPRRDKLDVGAVPLPKFHN